MHPADMMLTTLLESVRMDRDRHDLLTPSAADEAAIVSAALFAESLGARLPPAYETVLRQMNGLRAGLRVLFPASLPSRRARPGDAETFEEANSRLREDVSPDYLYFGQEGDALFAQHLPSGCFMAFNWVSPRETVEGVRRFADAYEMFEFIAEGTWPVLPIVESPESV